MTDLHIRAASASDIGLRRTNNQDTSLCADGVYIVCDGMGGGVGGQRASSVTARWLGELASHAHRDRRLIARTLDQAQREVLAIGRELGGVSGTTVCGLICPSLPEGDADGSGSLHGPDDEGRPGDWYVVNIGDSRTYHIEADGRGGWDPSSIIRVTKDHSQRQAAIDSGQMLPQDAWSIPRNIITQCIGDPDGIRPDFYAVQPRGRFIICSDGLHGEAGDESIATVASRCAGPEEAVDSLIQLALQCGRDDNITVIVVDVTDAGGHGDGGTDGGGTWRAARLGVAEDLDTLGDETLDNIRIHDVLTHQGGPKQPPRDHRRTTDVDSQRTITERTTKE